MRRFWIVFLIVIVIAAFYGWQNGPQWLASWNSGHQQMVEQQRAAGTAFGRKNDQQACFSSALARLESCKETEYKCTVSNGMYLRACWQESLPVGDFCGGVPAFSESPSEDDKAWIKDRCLELGATAKGCRILLKQKMQLCSNG